MELSTRHKALKINLAQKFYGTLSEVGAGQEVARHFFQAGGASGAIAKTMSAYDMIFSDSIYGKEPSGRYVCESRVLKMLTKEFNLLVERLKETKASSHRFFTFANTISALNYTKTNQAHGWLGVRFQNQPGGPEHDVVIHLNMFDPHNLLQQDALGIVGVNLIYACLFLTDNSELFVRSLLDNLDTSRVEIDFIKFNGIDFKHIDNRLISLQLVKEDFTQAVMFDQLGNVVLASDFLYKKDVIVTRGSYRPPTLVSLDMIETGKNAFEEQYKIAEKNIFTISEITISTLKEDGAITNDDFLARVDLLVALGQRVLVTNFPHYYQLTAYFSKFKVHHLSLVLGIYNFQQIFDNEYSKLAGGVFAALAAMFRENVSVLVYPYMNDKNEVETLKNLKIEEAHKHLFEHLIATKQIVDLKKFNKEILHIFSRKVLEMIINKNSGWEKMVPESVAKTINEKCLFGHPCDY